MERKKNKGRQQGDTDARGESSQTGYSPEDWEVQQRDQGDSANENDLSEQDRTFQPLDSADDPDDAKP